MNDNLKELLKLAFEQSPNETEYFIMRMITDMPQYITDDRYNSYCNEYMMDEPASTIENPRKKELHNFLSYLRSTL